VYNNIDYKADCTHQTYSTYFYDPMWAELEREVARLEKLLH
jgi:hypothetical protein